MVASSPLLPLHICGMAVLLLHTCGVVVLPTDVRLPELMFSEITPGVVISSSDDFYDTGYQLK